MLTLDDSGRDGKKKAYLADQVRWRYHDPELFDALNAIAHESTSISQVEQLSALADFKFWDAEVPDTLTGRLMYMRKVRSELEGIDLVFFDPDNGLDVASVPKGRKNSSKYIFRDELAEFYAAGKSVLFYQHYPRLERRSYEQSVGAELRTMCADSVTYCFSTGHVAFFLAAHQHHFSLVSSAAELAAAPHMDMFTRKRLEELEVLANLIDGQGDKAK